MTQIFDLQRRLVSHILRDDAPAADALLFDPVTELPGLQLLAREVELVLTSRKSAGIVTVSIAQLSRLEEVYGWEVFDDIVRGFAACLRSIKDESLRSDDAVAELTVNGNVFILMLSPPREERAIRFSDLQRVKTRMAKRLDAYIAEALNPELVYRVNYFIGCAVMKREPSVRFERLLYRAIDEALNDATADQTRLVRSRARKLRGILDQKRITTLFQPIVDLQERRTAGYEALSRGPRGAFRSPDVLFRAAYEADLVLKLDAVCRERALRALRRIREDQLLFINLEPRSIFDSTLMESIPTHRVPQVVFEITEHAAIADFATFRQAVQLVKRSGCKFALDDVGSAYSGLRVISAIEPDFIKLDMALTRAVQSSRVKMQLVRAIAGFCTETRVPMIVEGIETDEELRAVTGLGAQYGQGYLLGSPGPTPAHSRHRPPPSVK